MKIQDKKITLHAVTLTHCLKSDKVIEMKTQKEKKKIS